MTSTLRKHLKTRFEFHRKPRTRNQVNSEINKKRSQTFEDKRIFFVFMEI